MRISDGSSDVCSSDLGFKTLADGHADQLGRYGNRDGGNDDIESFGPAIGRHQKAAAVHFDTPYGCAGSHIDSFGYQRVFHDRVHLLESGPRARKRGPALRSEEHTSELQSLMRISYAVFCLKKKNIDKTPL